MLYEVITSLLASLLLIPTLDNELARRVLALAGLVAHGGLTPGSYRAGTADGRAALAAAVGIRITSYNVCYTKLLRGSCPPWQHDSRRR